MKPRNGGLDSYEMGEKQPQDVELIGDPTPHEDLQKDLTEPAVRHARTLEWLTKFVIIACCCAMSIAFVVSVVNGAWWPLSAAWAVVGPIVGAITMYYYTRGT